MYCKKITSVYAWKRDFERYRDVIFIECKKIYMYMYVFRKEWPLRRLWLQSVSVPYFLERCMYFVLNSLSVFWKKIKKSPFPFRLFKGDDKLYLHFECHAVLLRPFAVLSLLLDQGVCIFFLWTMKYEYEEILYNWPGIEYEVLECESHAQLLFMLTKVLHRKICAKYFV